MGAKSGAWAGWIWLSLLILLAPAGAQWDSGAQDQDFNGLGGGDFFDEPFEEFNGEGDGFGDALDPENCQGDCGNVTQIPLERDQLLEALVHQTWTELKAKSFAPDYLRVSIDPLNIRDHVNSSLSFQQTTSLYSADLNISSMLIEGLSRMEMMYIDVFRDEELNFLDINSGLSIKSLAITGEYSLKGSVGWWDLDSQGTKPFAIHVADMRWTPELKIQVLDKTALLAGNCQSDYGISITKLVLPAAYSNATFAFEGIGSFANNVINGLGAYILQTHGDAIVQEVKRQLQETDLKIFCRHFLAQ